MTKVRMKDVADAVGVSVGAVGRVLNGTGIGSISVGPETEKRIQEAAARLGYRVNFAARQLRGGRSGIVGLITHKGTSEEGVRRIVDIERAASSAGLDVMVAILEADRMVTKLEREQVARAFERFTMRGVDGVICMSWNLRDVTDEMLGGMPIAYIGPAEFFRDRPGVHLDAVEGGRIAMRHLIDKGRRRIGFAMARHAFARSRVKGAREILKQEGIPFDPLCVLFDRTNGYGTDELAEIMVERLVVEQGVDGLIVENDHWAMRILKELRSRGISVPKQVSVIGYNNLPFCEYADPALTSLDEREEEIAFSAVKVIQGLIEGRKEAHKARLMSPVLVEREST
jgi:DNA-binding LacI/PurR family transcriptional regulator